MFWKENVPLSYSRMRELFIQAFKQFVSDIKSYGLHCLRSGGATAACIFLFLIDCSSAMVDGDPKTSKTFMQRTRLMTCYYSITKWVFS